MTSSPQVMLIHGWCANHHIFDDWRTRANMDTRFWQTPDLPGHGITPLVNNAFDIDTIAQNYAATIDKPIHLVGWSLGGMIALSLAANYPDKVKTLCLTASLAKLKASPDYPQGLNHETLTAMVDRFQQQYAKFMQQFIALQLLFAPAEQQQKAQQLLPTLCQYGTPSGLSAALNALQQTDLRPLLPKILAPTLLIFGQRDTITPPAMGEYLHQHITHSQWQLWPQAAHIPFLSHPDLFTQSLQYFWECHS